MPDKVWAAVRKEVCGMTFMQALDMMMADSGKVMVRHVGVGRDGLVLYVRLDSELETGVRRFHTDRINWDHGAVITKADLRADDWALLSEDRLVVGETR